MLKDARWTFDPEKGKATMVYVIDDEPLSTTKRHFGPQVGMEKAIKEFKKKHKKIIIAHNRVYALKKRKYTTIEPLIRDLMKSVNVSSRAKKILIASS